MFKRSTTLWLCLSIATALVPMSGHAQRLQSDEIYVVDGDTIRIDDETFRLVGFDTPETWRPECEYERALGESATLALQNYINTAFTRELIVLPGRDRYDRGLARFMIDGQDVGHLLISANLARAYNGGRRTGWCN